MSDVWGLLLVFFAVVTAMFAGVLVLGIWRHRSLRAALDNPAGSWSAALVLLFGTLTLVSAAGLLGQQEGRWRYMALVGINLWVQPVCGFLVVASGHMFVLGVLGRLTYRLRVVPREACEPLLYRQMVRRRAVAGLCGVMFFGGLAVVCLWALL